MAAGASFACWGSYFNLKGEEIAPGTYRVLRQPGMEYNPSGYSDTTGVVRVADLRENLDSLIAGSALVFIGRIDSVLGEGRSDDTLIPAMEPAWVLHPDSADADTSSHVFYAHLGVDTVLKGELPAGGFWFRGYMQGSDCDLSASVMRTGPFLNFSDDFNEMSDLKVSGTESFCASCPRAYEFDGRSVASPDFPVLKLDIRELFPDYPVVEPEPDSFLERIFREIRELGGSDDDRAAPGRDG